MNPQPFCVLFKYTPTAGTYNLSCRFKTVSIRWNLMIIINLFGQNSSKKANVKRLSKFTGLFRSIISILDPYFKLIIFYDWPLADKVLELLRNPLTYLVYVISIYITDILFNELLKTAWCRFIFFYFFWLYCCYWLNKERRWIPLLKTNEQFIQIKHSFNAWNYLTLGTLCF